MDRRRYIGHKKFAKDYDVEIKRIDEDGLSGYTSLLKIKEVHQPITYGDICICDSGYSMLEFLPDGENWALEAIYDRGNNIVEWYFDITKKNAVDEQGRPYNEDLYLDVILLPSGQVVVCDEDELEDALNNKEITQKEFDTAYTVLRDLKEKKILDVAYVEALCSKLQRLFA